MDCCFHLKYPEYFENKKDTSFDFYFPKQKFNEASLNFFIEESSLVI